MVRTLSHILGLPNDELISRSLQVECHGIESKGKTSQYYTVKEIVEKSDSRTKQEKTDFNEALGKYKETDKDTKHHTLSMPTSL